MLSIIVPAYNEEKTIESLIEEIKENLKKIDVKSEIIVVDDYSIDNTHDKLKDIKGIKVIRHPYNKGYGAALKTGTRAAKGDYVLFIDGDGEHDPKYIKDFVEHMEYYEMVVGAREVESSFYRGIAKRFLNMFANYLSEVHIEDLNCGYRAIKKDILMEYLDSLPNRFSLTTTVTMIFAKSGYNIRYIPIQTRKRTSSHISPLKDFLKFMTLIMKTAFTFSPLRILIPTSLFFFLAGLIYASYSLYLTSDIPDSAIFLFTTSVILFLFGFLADQVSSFKLSKR